MTTTIATDYSTTRPRVCAFFAGRAWYAGVTAADKSGWVLFSQVATHTNRLNKCYQNNDPTSEQLSDLMDDDGGVIPIPDSGEIVSLKPAGNVLLVFSSKGVWSIMGGDNGFKATQYSVSRISSEGCVSNKTIVAIKDTIFYWSQQTINAIKIDQIGNNLIESISELKIKSLYQNIPLLSKINTRGVYNDSEKVVYWSYCDDVDLFDTYGYYYKNTLLKYDVFLQAFYLEKIEDGSPYITTLAVTRESYNEVQEVDVAVDTELVETSTDVVSNIYVTNSGVKQTKFLTLTTGAGTTTSVTFSNYDEDRNGFKDWKGQESSAYIITGYMFGNNGPVRNKVAPTVSVFAIRTEEEFDSDLEATKQSSILMQTRWDFTNNSNPNKWSSDYEVYRQLRPYYISTPGAFDDGYPLVITRNKVRGHGKALQIKWTAGTNKDMQIAGWSINYIGNTNV